MKVNCLNVNIIQHIHKFLREPDVLVLIAYFDALGIIASGRNIGQTLLQRNRKYKMELNFFSYFCGRLHTKTCFLDCFVPRNDAKRQKVPRLASRSPESINNYND